MATLSRRFIALICATALFLALPLLAAATVHSHRSSVPSQSKERLSILYSFSNKKHFANGGRPDRAVVVDKHGNIFGTTAINSLVYELIPSGSTYSERTVFQFPGGAGGFGPGYGLIEDKQGALYGTADGGDGPCPSGCGIAFELVPSGNEYVEKVLHAFQAGTDGNVPSGPLVADSKGNLFGTTFDGGGNTNCNEGGDGTVFELSSSASGNYTERIVHAFNGADGCWPLCGVPWSPSERCTASRSRVGCPYLAGLQAFRPSARPSDIASASIHYVQRHRSGRQTDLAKAAADRLVTPSPWSCTGMASTWWKTSLACSRVEM